MKKHLNAGIILLLTLMASAHIAYAIATLVAVVLIYSGVADYVSAAVSVTVYLMTVFYTFKKVRRWMWRLLPSFRN